MPAFALTPADNHDILRRFFTLTANSATTGADDDEELLWY